MDSVWPSKIGGPIPGVSLYAMLMGGMMLTWESRDRAEPRLFF